MRLLTIAAAALAALLLTIALANAQEPPESQTATRLEPGINLVGWVGEPASTSQLFDEIPQLESIWAWDAELDDWIVAGRGAPERLGWLWRVSPGVGLRLVLGGEDPFLWERSTEPTRGLVKLRTGWNLVAWSGADGAPIEQVAKGIGWSLRELRRWNAANQRWTTWTSPERSAQLIATSATDQGATDEESEPVTVRRGEALWINVARSVNWLQPTDILPRLVFPGGASDELQARVREDLEAVLAFYGQQYGIQADPDFTIYVAKDDDALIQAYKDDGHKIDADHEASIRARWERTAGQIIRGGLIIRQDLWPEDLAAAQSTTFGDYVITHEYTHILQNQLLHRGGSATWLLEGGAEWAAGEREALSGGQSLHDRRDSQWARLRTFFPSLRSTEAGSGPFYLLGWLAMDRLIQEHGADSWIEIWRRRALTQIGPHGRWESSPDWRTALREVSGVSTSDFYADFAAWQRDQALKNERTGDAGTPPPLIQGRVTDSAGVAVAGILVAAVRVEGGDSAGRGESADTAVDGQFVVLAPEAGDYLVSVNIIVDVDDPCTLYYSNGRLIDERDEAQLVTVARSGLQGVDIQLPHNICSRQISRQIKGRVVDTNGEPLAGVLVVANSADHSTRPRRTASDGTFSMALKDKGDYRLSLALGDSCTVYYRSSGTTTSFDNASLISVSDASAADISIRIPASACAHRIIGSIVIAGGQPLADTYVSACREVDGRCVAWFGRNTDEDGAFAITVPDDGRYRVSFSLEGCTIYFRAGGFTTSYSERSTARVVGRDARLNPRQIPQDLCALRRISGSITAADGQPLVDAYISACHESDDGPCAGYRTESDGSFSITVPEEGAYSLSFNLDGCTIHFRARGFTMSREERGTFRVDGRDVRLAPRQIPQGMCAMGRINGSVATADGQPFAGAYISACREVVSGPCSGDRTGSDGSFSITVPEAGAYRLWFNLDGCSSLIYFSARSFTTERADRLVTHVADRELHLDSRRIPADLCPRIIGRVTKTDGQPLTGAYVEACREVDGACVESARGRIGYDGSFAVAVPTTGSYRLAYNLDGCELYYGSTGLTSNAAEAIRLEPGDRDLRIGHRLVLDNMCAYQIGGVVVSNADALFIGARVIACEQVDGECVSRVYRPVGEDGRFAITVPVDGAYLLILQLSYCSVYFGQEGLTGNRNDAWLFRVAGQDIRLSQRQASTESCNQQLGPLGHQQISGQIINADGQPLADTDISVHDDRAFSISQSTNADGSFAITVPAGTAYNVNFSLDGCSLYFSATGLTADRDQRLLVRVFDRDLQLAPRQIPGGMCAHRISGRFVDANGAPLEKWINIYGSDGSHSGISTDVDGRFTLRVAGDGAYTIEAWLLNNCRWHGPEEQALGSRENPVRVSGADVTGVELRLPGTVEELCG